MSEYACEACRDTRHVLKDGVWVKCECYLKLEATLKYSRAKICRPPEELSFPEGIRKYYPDSLLCTPAYAPMVEYIKAIQKHIERKEFPNKSFCFYGLPHSPADYVVECLLKSAVDAGLTVGNFRVDELIERHFKEQECGGDSSTDSYSFLEEFSRVDVFSLYFGSEIPYRVGETYVTEIVKAHLKESHKKMLLLSTSSAYDGLTSVRKYSSTFKDMFNLFITGENANNSNLSKSRKPVFLSIR